MSSKYPGGIISKTAPTPSGPYADSTAPGVWTLEQQAYWQKLGQWPTAGNVNPNAFIENLFSTYLYTGNSSTNTIPNGIDLSTKGGLIWLKQRNAAVNHGLFDTIRGGRYGLYSNTTNGNIDWGSNVVDFGTTGQTINNFGDYNDSGQTYASWTFREQAKFFDIVTWTGNGVSGRAIPHNLQSAPGFIAVKILSSADNWECYHRGITFNSANVLWLNSSNALTTGGARFTSQPTSTDFYVGSDSGVNGSGQTYVAYLFAHDAGGFGLTGTDNVISCGTFTDSGADQSINLGYEPQWVLVKRTSSSGDWWLVDNMRGMPVGSVDATLKPNTADAEQNAYSFINPEATGFRWITGQISSSGQTFIYIAIRRGPMKVPTSGTSVFSPVAYAGDDSATRLIDTGINIDMHIAAKRSGPDFFTLARLIGTPYLRTRSANAETSSAGSNGIPTILTNENNKFGFIAGATNLANVNATGSNYVDWAFVRAPNFMDVVCYTGNSTARTLTHNLTVAPELMLVKQRSGSEVWSVYYGDNTDYLVLNSDQATADSNIYWNDTSPTSSVFTVGTGNEVNGSGSTYVAYLFATCAGVSKVGSYTGTGAAQTINCGFTAGVRFVLIKRTDSIDSWYVWDSARGIIAGNDPYFLINSAAAEVTGTDYVDTTSVGFDITSTAPSAINANGGTFIFLAIA